jgi:putative endonuclease
VRGLPKSGRRFSDKSPRPERLAAEGFGHRGETLAALYLMGKLYRVVARRVKTPVGEIDLVVRRFGVTVFVEVKARKRYESEAEALGAVNRRRIVKAALWYVSQHPRLAERPMRFDVIFLAPGKWPRHLSNAFDATGIA